jgi:hypothetical protein
MKQFVFRDEITGKKYVIPIISGPDIDEDFFYDKVIPEIEKRKLESRYGIHDYNTAGEDEVLGFTTYEVGQGYTEGGWDGLMGEWKEILVRLGFEVGELEII